MPRVLILSGLQLSTNPRVVKEADTLSEAGYSVEVVGALLEPELMDRDSQLSLGKRWTYTILADASSRSAGNRVRWLALRARRRLWRELGARLGSANARQLGYIAPEMLGHALRRQADLVIVHNPQSMWVGAELIRRGKRVGVDMEDWYSEDVVLEDRGVFPADALRQWEGYVLRHAASATTTSQSLSRALAAAYGCPAPAVVHNSFSWKEREHIDGEVLDRTDCALPSVCWFSQVIGADRGLETLMDALVSVNVACEIHLRGHSVPEYRRLLLERAPESWRKRVHFHPQVPHSQLISRIAEHDLGIAAEIPYSRNKALTIANKLPFYLLAGVPVIASDTDGQREAAALAKDAVFLFTAGDPRELGQVLNRLLTDQALLLRAREKAVSAAMNVFSWEKSAPVLLSQVERAIVARMPLLPGFPQPL